MSKLSKEQILHIANLARLNVSPEELEKLEHEFGPILAFVDEVSKVDAEGVKENALQLKNIAREDVIAPLDSAYNLVEAAPLHRDNFVEVPKVIGE